MSRLDNLNMHRIKIFIALSIILSMYSNLYSNEKYADKPLYLYYHPYFYDDAASVLKKYREGDFSPVASPDKFFFGTSVWVYLSRDVVMRDAGRSFLLTGYQDEIEVYSIDKNTVSLQTTAGKFLKKSELSDQRGRYFVQLYTDAGQIRDGYLVAYRKLHDNNHTPLQATFSDAEGVKKWRVDYLYSRLWMIVAWHVAEGMVLFAIMLMLVRYFITKKLSYIYYILWMLVFYVHFSCVFFQSPIYCEKAFLDSPRLNLVVSHSLVLLAVPFVILSFKHFHYTSKARIKDYEENLRLRALFMLRFCLVVFIVILLVNYFTSFYALGSFIMQVSLLYIFGSLVVTESNYRKNLDFPNQEAHTAILKGSIFFLIVFFSGCIMTLMDFIFKWGLGYEVTLTFVGLAGFILHSFVAFVAFNQRDNEIAQERNLLFAQSIEYELRSIQNSLNPHFIFNSLNLIDSMILKNEGEKARTALRDFSNLLRLVIDKSANKLISLKDEIRIVELYLQVEKLRNNKLFDFQIITQQDLDIRFYRVPPMILQPLVENAIKHGIMNRREQTGGEIILRIGCKEDVLIFEVEDNGIGYNHMIDNLTPGYFTRKHIGIEFTKKRIALLTGENYTGKEIQIMDKSEMSDETGTILRFNLPIIK